MLTINKLILVCLVMMTLAACSDHHYPTWQLHATSSPLLQARQVNSPYTGRNYVLCAHCVQITPLTSQHSSREKHS